MLESIKNSYQNYQHKQEEKLQLHNAKRGAAQYIDPKGTFKAEDLDKATHDYNSVLQNTPGKVLHKHGNYNLRITSHEPSWWNRLKREVSTKTTRLHAQQTYTRFVEAHLKLATIQGDAEYYKLAFEVKTVLDVDKKKVTSTEILRTKANALCEILNKRRIQQHAPGATEPELSKPAIEAAPTVEVAPNIEKQLNAAPAEDRAPPLQDLAAMTQRARADFIKELPDDQKEAYGINRELDQDCKQAAKSVADAFSSRNFNTASQSYPDESRVAAYKAGQALRQDYLSQYRNFAMVNLINTTGLLAYLPANDEAVNAFFLGLGVRRLGEQVA